MEHITCENCKKTIKKKEDANFLAFLGFVPKAFCNNCYSSKERGILRHFLYFPQQPINGKMYKYGLIILSIIYPLIIILFLFSMKSAYNDVGLVLFMFVLFFFIIGSFVGFVWPWILYFKVKRKLDQLA